MFILCRRVESHVGNSRNEPAREGDVPGEFSLPAPPPLPESIGDGFSDAVRLSQYKQVLVTHRNWCNNRELFCQKATEVNALRGSAVL